MKYVVGYVRSFNSHDDFVEIKGFNTWDEAFEFYLSIYPKHQVFLRIKNNVNREWEWLKYTVERM